MRLLNIYTLKFQEFYESEIPHYHILSHRWSRDEISYEEFCRDRIPDKRGYRKILDFCKFIRQRRQDGLISRKAVDPLGAHRITTDDMSELAAHGFEPEAGERPPLAGGEWVWVDTCCIDKRSSAELTEAINSMFKWYAASYECIVRLTDVPSWQHFGKTSPYRKTDRNDRLDELKNRDPDEPYYRYSDNVSRRQRSEMVHDLLGNVLPHLSKSMWFTRGWTLQELLAPELVVLYNSSWEVVGHVCKSDRCTRNMYAYGIHLTEVVSAITGIPERYLGGEEPIQGASIAQRMSWASGRITSRLEDEAYCLLGIFSVNMPLLYGEGHKAFRRLQLEIIQSSTDQSIFAWTHGEGFVPIFAASPAAFKDSSNITRAAGSGRTPYSITNNGLKLRTKLYRPAGVGGEAGTRLIRLACRNGKQSKFTIKVVKGQQRYFRSITTKSLENVGELLGEKVVYLDTGVEDTDVPEGDYYTSDSSWGERLESRDTHRVFFAGPALRTNADYHE